MNTQDTSPAEPSALELHLRALRPLFAQFNSTELCINRPEEAYFATPEGWQHVPLSFADLHWCRRLAKLAANATGQHVDETAPLLSAALPGGEHIDIAVPTATPQGCIAITLRLPSPVASLHRLTEGAHTRDRRRSRYSLDDSEIELIGLLKDNDHAAFIRRALKARQNILISIPFPHRNPLWMNALVGEITRDERLIAMAHRSGFAVASHPNGVNLCYPDTHDSPRLTPKRLLAAALRMAPDRLLLPDLTAETAFDSLQALTAGPLGSIASIHATTPHLALEQLALLAKQSESARQLTYTDVKGLVSLLVDVVIQCGIKDGEHYIQDIAYDPVSKKRSITSIG